jgi:hypothetical protein
LLIIDDRASLHKVGFDYDHSQHRRLYRCSSVATVPAERRALGLHAINKPVHHNEGNVRRGT